MISFELSCSIEAERDIPHITVPEVWALDYDETLGSGRAAMARLGSVACQFGITPEELRAHQQMVQDEGRSFNAFSYIKTRLGQEPDGAGRFDDFGQAFLDESQPSFLFPDAVRLLDTLTSNPAVPHMILTYGEGVGPADLLYQAVKLAASGYHGNAELTTNPNKGPHIDQWVGEDGTYDFIAHDKTGEPVAVFHAQNTVLVDDKASSLANLERDARGVLVMRPDEPRTAKQGYELPQSVASRSCIIDSLDDLVPRESYHYTGCNSVRRTRTLFSRIVGFEPATADPANPNIYVYPGMSFRALRTAVEQLPLAV